MSTVVATNITEVEAPLRRWTRGEFDRMLDTDLFSADEDVMLRDGQVYRWGEPNPRLWTRSEYYRLADTGILGWDEPIEMLEGEITDKVTIRPPHSVATSKTARVLEAAFGPDCFARHANPLYASAYSEPEPDVILVSGEPDDYVSEHPTPAAALLVIEVSDTTLRKDRGKKARIYAVAGCREYWIVNLQKRTLEIYRDPVADGDESKAFYTEAEATAGRADRLRARGRPAASGLPKTLKEYGYA